MFASFKRVFLMALLAWEVVGAREHAGWNAVNVSSPRTRTLLEEASGEGDPCVLEALQDYNLPLHIGSVFILLGVSLLGSLFPVGLRITTSGNRVTTAIRLGTYFGFGTILSTALIHMLLPAVESLTSECLPASFTDAYEAWPFLFATISIMVMSGIDFLIKGWLRRQSVTRQPEHASAHAGCHAGVIGAIVGASSSAQAAQAAEAEEGGTCAVHGHGCTTLLPHKPDVCRAVGIYAAEAGIIFHSVMIGLTLGVASGTSFPTLLAALCFHQFFEGFALGSAAVDAGLGTAKSAMLGLAYSITTPIGIAVGIGVRESFNQSSTGALLATGILDALSAGILLYVALVQLVTPMMTDCDWLHTRRWPMQVLAFAAFWGGAAAMAVIGKWA